MGSRFYYVKCLFRKKLRTTLTIVSIAIGICAVLIIGTISDTGKLIINKELDSLGINGISLSVKENAAENQLQNEDLKYVRSLPFVDDATPIIMGSGFLKTEDDNNSVILWGVDSGAEQVISLNLISGRNFTRADISKNAKVCLLDKSTAERLFEDKSFILNREIEIFISGSTKKFKIVGIIETDSGILQGAVGEYIPTLIYIPYTTLQSETGTNSLSQIAVKVAGEGEEQVDILSHKIENAVNSQKGLNGAIKADNLTKQRSKLTGTLDIITMILSLIGAISLLVAGLGTMTVMLFSVTERTKEIGIKKSIGAKRRDIIKEFLCESTILSVLGCVLGIAVTFILVTAASFITGISLSLNAYQIFLALGVSLLSGVVFGIYPAYCAAKLNPVEALRRE